MADTEIAYEELRIDVRDPELTQVYVFINNISNDGLLGVHGWHHKTFPARMSMLDILREWANGKEDPLMWPQKAPDKTE